MIWRVLFAAAGVLMAMGGPRHPGGPMLEMLRHHDWFMAHALVTLGYATMAAGLVAFSRTEANTPALRRWTRLAIVGTALQTLEMAVHTAAMVDAEHLAAGHATPVLTTHLAMSMVFYPLFGIASAAFFIKGMRERAIGSPWIVWIGVIGTVANGIAPILVGLFGWQEARILFAFMIGIAVWLLLAAVWPTVSGIEDAAAIAGPVERMSHGGRPVLAGRERGNDRASSRPSGYAQVRPTVGGRLPARASDRGCRPRRPRSGVCSTTGGRFGPIAKSPGRWMTAAPPVSPRWNRDAASSPQRRDFPGVRPSPVE